MSIRLLIADDHGVLRAGLRALLNAEPEFEVVGEAETGEEALHMAESLRPDVVLLDVSMPGLSGIEVTREMKARFPDMRVLILTVHEDETLLREALRAGAAGYIVKRAMEEELIAAILAVWRGDLYVHPAMTRALLQDVAERQREEAASRGENQLAQLTPREREVLRLIALGYTNRQIADKLCISVRTVETHRSNLTDKLGTRSRAQLVRIAREHGLLD